MHLSAIEQVLAKTDQGYGAFYDLDRDGTEELFLMAEISCPMQR